MFSWFTKKQDIVAQSNAEAEFIAATAVVNQVLWLKKVLCDLDIQHNDKTETCFDNQAAIAISKDPVCYGKTKHFNIKLYFLQEVPQSGEVNLLVSVEVDYDSVVNVVSESCWLQNLLLELYCPIHKAIMACCDKLNDMYLYSNPIQHQRTKHLEVDIHFVCEKWHVDRFVPCMSLRVMKSKISSVKYLRWYFEFKGILNVGHPPAKTLEV